MTHSPVCKMRVDAGTAMLTRTYETKTYVFCSEKCLNRFDTKPEHYIKPSD
jgi:YHS domain-containing protein